MVESARVRQHKKKLRGVIDTSRRSRFKLNMHKRPEPTLSNGRQRIWVSQELRRHPGPEILMTAVPYPPRKQEKKYQQQQDKQIAKQQQERDKLQQQQDQEHVKLDKQKANDAQKQQVEQKHQQQTQQLQQRHQQQTQQLQQRQQPTNREPSKR